MKQKSEESSFMCARVCLHVCVVLLFYSCQHNLGVGQEANSLSLDLALSTFSLVMTECLRS